MSTEISGLNFGLVMPLERDFGALAKAILKEADGKIRQDRSKAFLYLIPSIIFYLFFSAGVALVLWSLGLDLSPPFFLVFVALSFLFMAGLGRYYQMETTAGLLDADLKIQQILLMQAFIVRVITAIFFIFPYRTILNLSRLFPRPAKVNSQIVHLAVNIASALDVPVRAKEIKTILPEPLWGIALEEALRLLKWSGMVETLPRSGDIFIYPSEKLDRVKREIKVQPEAIRPFSNLLA